MSDSSYLLSRKEDWQQQPQSNIVIIYFSFLSLVNLFYIYFLDTSSFISDFEENIYLLSEIISGLLSKCKELLQN